MKLKELYSFRLSDAIKFHDNLNPKLFAGKHLQPRVRSALLKIARDFKEYLGLDKLSIKDVTLSGSNAAYTYTDHSDIDLHLVVDFNDLDPDEVYRELFNSKKNLYNDSIKIKIHNIDVECYVQDSNEPVKSIGEYSVLKNSWIKIPRKSKTTIDHTVVRNKYNKLKSLVEVALRSSDSKMIDRLLKKIRQYRSAGLAKNGEFSVENIAFKALRSQGVIGKLYKMRDSLRGRELSIENKKSPFTR